MILTLFSRTIREYGKEYKKKPEVKERRNIRQKIEYHEDIAKRFRQNLSRTLNHKLKTVMKGGCLRGKNTIEYLGCSMDEFIQHIENQFEEGMSWENYGRKRNVRCWHLDHIIPALFKENEADNDKDVSVDTIIKRSHYTNFQPMWEDENISKSNKYVGKYIKG